MGEHYSCSQTLIFDIGSGGDGQRIVTNLNGLDHFHYHERRRNFKGAKEVSVVLMDYYTDGLMIPLWMWRILSIWPGKQLLATSTLLGENVKATQQMEEFCCNVISSGQKGKINETLLLRSHLNLEWPPVLNAALAKLHPHSTIFPPEAQRTFKSRKAGCCWVVVVRNCGNWSLLIWTKCLSLMHASFKMLPFIF